MEHKRRTGTFAQRGRQTGGFASALSLLALSFAVVFTLSASLAILWAVPDGGTGAEHAVATQAEAALPADGAAIPVSAQASRGTVYAAVVIDAPVQVCLQDNSDHSTYIKGARFTLANSAGTVIWESEPTGEDGTVSIPRVDAERAGGEGATFEPGSTYTLKQTRTDSLHFLPKGTWTLKVDEQGAFTLTAVSDPGDQSTLAANGPFGKVFYLYNMRASSITYDYNYPAGASGQPASHEELLPFLAYDGSYTVEQPDPELSGYEFAGWSVDGTNRVVKRGAVLTLDTVNVLKHTMTAQWRIPLNVEALTYSGGKAGDAAVVAGSEGAYAIAQERALTFTTLGSFCEAYGEQNAAVRELEGSGEYGFAYAEIERQAGSSVRVVALRYESSSHAWQYEQSAQGSWTSVGRGDVLKLYYTRDLVSIRWVVQGEDGSFTPLDEGRFPDRNAAVGADWKDSGELVAKADTPVAEGESYYRCLGVGAQDAESASGLVKNDLGSFSLRNTEAGFRFRTGSAGEGELLEGDIAIFVVYSADPPDTSVYLDIDNRSAYPYRIDRVLLGSGSTATDMLSLGLVVKEGDETRRVVAAGETVAVGEKARLALLGPGAAPFVLEGGFVESALDGTIVSVAVASEQEAVRTSVEKRSAADNGLADTSPVTRGVFSRSQEVVTVKFDSQTTSLTVKKEWSADAFPERYQVDFNLLEDGVPCMVTEQGGAVVYTLSADDWSITFDELPALPDGRSYSVAEKAVRQVDAYGRTVSDVTADFKATYTSGDGLITVYNERSNPVCQVSGEQFLTVQAAVEYIGAHGRAGTIEMIDDYVMPESAAVTVPAGYDIVLRTASGQPAKTITRGFTGSADLFCVRGALRIEDVTLSGKLNDAFISKTGNGGLVTVEGASARLTAAQGSAFTGGRADNGSAIYAASGAAVVLDGARITGNQSITGGAVGVSDATCSISVSGDTYVSGNGDGDGRGARNVYLDCDSNEVLRVGSAGLGDGANVGVYVPDGEGRAQWGAHGQPAKPFAVFATGAAGNLGKLVSDRLSGPGKYGSASDILGNTVVWGETFSFKVNVQWLDEHFERTGAPAGTVTLALAGGSTTPAATAPTSIDCSAANGWSCVFRGLAKYDANGNPCAYTVSETQLPADFKRVAFTGDIAVKDSPVRYDESTGNGQVAVVSNYYRYTTFTVSKVVATEGQQLTSSFAIYGVPKTGADLSDGAIRFGGVGGVNDLPGGLRGGTADAGDGRFYTTGANRWFVTTASGTVEFHRFYDSALHDVERIGSGFALEGVAWQAGDVVRANGGSCYVYGSDHTWRQIADASVSYIDFTRQDGKGGAESVGGQSMGRSFTIANSGTRTFTTADKLSSDYYYYVVETSVRETNGKGRTISGTHKLVATYDPRYRYDQLRQSVTVTNTRQDYLSVDKEWPEDTVNRGTCVFDVYEVGSGSTVSSLKDQSRFAALVRDDYTGKTPVLTFSLPEEDTGSWVHVLKEDEIDANSKTYIVRERTAGGVPILNPDVTDSGIDTDAVLSYDDEVNQITVHNMSSALCKVVDGDGAEHPFRKLNDALAYGRTRTTGDSNTEFAIEMLREYVMPATDAMSLKAGEKITLTTASATPGAANAYPYTNDDPSVTRATITRKEGNAIPLITVTGEVGASSDTSVTLENIAFDGAGIQVNGRVGNVTYSNGGIVYARYASVALHSPAAGAGVEVRNSKASNGGAIYADQSNVEAIGATFADCQSTDTAGYADRGGGAVWTSGADVARIANSTFTRCTAKRSGGAVASMNENGRQTVVEGCTFEECRADVNGGGVYSRNLALSMGGAQAQACTFTGCWAGYRGGGAFHDNMKEGSATEVIGCTFTSCTTTTGGDHQNDRCGGGGLNTNAEALNLSGCAFDACRSYIRGGGVLHFNLNGTVSNVADCTFTSCESDRSGGGAMGLTARTQSITGCTVADCKALTSAGGGLDIACFDVDKDATVADCAFTGCVAGNANGGAICFGGRALMIASTKFDGCTATTQRGGAVAVSAGGSMEELDIAGCTFTGCTAPANYGGAVYSNSLALRLHDGSPSGAHTSFTDCSARGQGGAVYQDRNASGTSVAAENCTFSNCKSTNESGGALRVNATELDIAGCTFTGCSSRGHGGSVYQGIYSAYANGSRATMTGSAFKSSTAGLEGVNNHGGAVYTEAMALLVGGASSAVSFEDCTSYGSGGAIFHSRSAAAAAVQVENASFTSCTSHSGEGGALFSYAPSVTLTGVAARDCTSYNSGGFIFHNQYNGDLVAGSSIAIADSTFERCKSVNNWAGAVRTNAESLSITGKRGTATFKDCSAYQACGAVYQGQNAVDSSAAVTNVTFADCTAEQHRAGALYTTATTLEVAGSTFTGSISRYAGGAIYHEVNGTQLPTSTFTMGNSSFARCKSRESSGGAVYTNVLELSVTGQAGKATFSRCEAGVGHGGGIQHNQGAAAAKATLAQCSFDTCSANHATNSWGASGGGLYTTAPVLSLDDCSFAHCGARTIGGGVYHSVNNSDEAVAQAASAVLTACTFDDCSTVSYSGGGMYTNAHDLSVTGVAGTATFKDCTAQTEGGGLRHDRAITASPVTTLRKCSFEGCASRASDGGGLWTQSKDVRLISTRFEDCTARGHGGGVRHYVNGVKDASMRISQSRFVRCSSETGNGGALYEGACSLDVASTRFSSCTASKSGGCVYHDASANGDATFTAAECTFKGGSAAAGDGGAVYSCRSEVDMTGTSIENCSAAGNGGGLFQYFGDDRSVILDSCEVSGNKASKGGGVYFYSHGTITLRNGTAVTGNSLTNSTVDNAAGIYLEQNRTKATLVLGSEEAEGDTITVYDNKTSADAQSNVRLIRNGKKDNKSGRYENKNDSSDMMGNSIVVLSNLVKEGYGAEGTIGVCNPGPENTRFGMADVGYRTGVENIVSDIDTQRGMLDPADLIEHRRIIWYAPPVCKITDQLGRRMLTYDNGKTAAFASLAEAVEVLNVKAEGYLTDDRGVTPAQMQIQMLVSDYPLATALPALSRDVTLTTAAVGDTEFDYPRNAVSATCTITRAQGVSGPMLTVSPGVHLGVERVALDGGNRDEQPRVIAANGGIICGQGGSTVTLGSGAVLENSAVSADKSGGAVYITGSVNLARPALVMERNAQIRNCSAGLGGGVYLTGGVLFEVNDVASIEGCAASVAGGAVHVSPYATMTFKDNPNAVISGNRITNAFGEGAGIYLASDKSKLNLKLGQYASISGNYVEGTGDDARTNGGDAYPLLRQDIFIGDRTDPATSVTLTGEIDQPEGSIWVWAADAAHYKSEMQFASIAADSQGNPAFTPREQSLAALRNAQDDATSENVTGTYLYGIQGDGADVIWSFESGARQVVLKKVAEGPAGYDALSGAQFTVYKGKSTRAYVVRHDDGSRETLAGLVSGENGVFWIGRLPFGTYYLEETTVPAGYDGTARWFKLVVDESGAAMSRGAAARADL